MFNNKKVEGFILEILRSRLADFPAGTVETFERPDFLVHTKWNILGIEITRIFQKSERGEPSPQAREAERRKIVTSARRLYEKEDLPPVIVSVHFGAHLKLTRASRNSLSKQLAVAVLRHIPCEGECVTIDNAFDSPELSDEVVSMNIVRPSGLTKHQWNVPEAGYVQLDALADLQAVLNEKESLLSEYLINCRRCWLGIVAHCYSPSTLFELSDKAKKHAYQSSFERVFYIDAFTREITELNCRPPHKA